MKTPKKYLALYEEWMITGLLPKERGLCFEFRTYPDDHENGEWVVYEKHDKLFILIHPSPKEYALLSLMWGGDPGVFTPLRQTIVLLMAAMNNEL